MKKLLWLIPTIALMATTGANVVACGPGAKSQNTDDEIFSPKIDLEDDFSKLQVDGLGAHVYDLLSKKGYNPTKFYFTSSVTEAKNIEAELDLNITMQQKASYAQTISETDAYQLLKTKNIYYVAYNIDKVSGFVMSITCHGLLNNTANNVPTVKTDVNIDFDFSATGTFSVHVLAAVKATGFSIKETPKIAYFLKKSDLENAVTKKSIINNVEEKILSENNKEISDYSAFYLLYQESQNGITPLVGGIISNDYKSSSPNPSDDVKTNNNIEMDFKAANPDDDENISGIISALKANKTINAPTNSDFVFFKTQSALDAAAKIGTGSNASAFKNQLSRSDIEAHKTIEKYKIYYLMYEEDASESDTVVRAVIGGQLYNSFKTPEVPEEIVDGGKLSIDFNSYENVYTFVADVKAKALDLVHKESNDNTRIKFFDVTTDGLEKAKALNINKPEYELSDIAGSQVETEVWPDHKKETNYNVYVLVYQAVDDIISNYITYATLINTYSENAA